MSRFRKKTDAPPRTPEEKRKRLLGFAAIGVFLIFSLAIAWFVGRPLIEFVEEPDAFRAWVDSRGILSRIAFIGMVALQVVVAIIPGEPLEIGAGYAFGPFQGLLLCLIGMAVGAVIICWFVRNWGVKVIEIFFSMEKIRSLRFLQDEKRLHILVFLLFFIPGTPKDLITYCIWLTPMNFTTYLIISTIARIPSVVTSTIVGGAVGDQNYMLAIIVFVVTALVSGLGLFIYQKIVNRPKPEGDAADQ